MIPFEHAYDISVALGGESIDYPGDVPFSRQVTRAAEESGSCEVSSLSMSAHAGAHIDTPSHFIEGGLRLDDYAPERFILPAVVVAVTGEKVITADDVERCGAREGEAILFRTRNSDSGLIVSGVFRKDYVYLEPQAAALLAERKRTPLVGIDAVSVDPPDHTTHPAHRALLSRGVLILENINLARITPDRYTLLCLPLKIRAGEASPVRAVLLK